MTGNVKSRKRRLGLILSKPTCSTFEENNCENRACHYSSIPVLVQQYSMFPLLGVSSSWQTSLSRIHVYRHNSTQLNSTGQFLDTCWTLVSFMSVKLNSTQLKSTDMRALSPVLDSRDPVDSNMQMPDICGQWWRYVMRHTCCSVRKNVYFAKSANRRWHR
jgi:hypothetical protein